MASGDPHGLELLFQSHLPGSLFLGVVLATKAVSPTYRACASLPCWAYGAGRASFWLLSPLLIFILQMRRVWLVPGWVIHSRRHQAWLPGSLAQSHSLWLMMPPCGALLLSYAPTPWVPWLPRSASSELPSVPPQCNCYRSRRSPPSGEPHQCPHLAEHLAPSGPISLSCSQATLLVSFPFSSEPWAFKVMVCSVAPCIAPGKQMRQSDNSKKKSITHTFKGFFLPSSP